MTEIDAIEKKTHRNWIKSKEISSKKLEQQLLVIDLECRLNVSSISHEQRLLAKKSDKSRSPSPFDLSSGSSSTVEDLPPRSSVHRTRSYSNTMETRPVRKPRKTSACGLLYTDKPKTAKVTVKRSMSVQNKQESILPPISRKHSLVSASLD